MNKQRKAALSYRIEVIDRDHSGYGHTYVTIAEGVEESVVNRIAICTKDPGYYGTPDQWEALARLGHETYYPTPYGRNTTLHWQHYESNGEEEYCRHSIEKADSLGVMQWACKVLVNLSRNIAKASNRYYGPKDCYQFGLNCPWLVVEALERSGAQRIELVETGEYASQFVKAFSPLPEWRGQSEEAA
jgi:hypothetical protein